jgi:hypothetical protein
MSSVRFIDLTCQVCGPTCPLSTFQFDTYYVRQDEDAKLGTHSTRFMDEEQFDYINENGSSGWMYNIDCEGNALVCPTCGRFYLACPHCSTWNTASFTKTKLLTSNIVLCQFLGCDEPICDDDHADDTLIDFSDKDIDYVKNEDIQALTGYKMTGPDGGQSLKWRCRKCNVITESFDK